MCKACNKINKNETKPRAHFINFLLNKPDVRVVFIYPLTVYRLFIKKACRIMSKSDQWIWHISQHLLKNKPSISSYLMLRVIAIHQDSQGSIQV